MTIVFEICDLIEDKAISLIGLRVKLFADLSKQAFLNLAQFGVIMKLVSLRCH